MGVQYPPGTGLLLALFPEGQAVYGLNRIFLWIFGLVGIVVLIAAALRKAFLPVGLGVLSIALGLEILARMGALSFSINAVLPPLLLATILTVAAAALQDTERLTWALGAALAAGSFFGLATLIRIPSVLLAPGFLLLLWPSSFKSVFPRGPVAFGVGLTLFGVCPVLINQQHVAGAWFLPTYSPIDAAMPDTRLIRENFAYYLWNGPGSGDNWWLVIAAVGYLAAAAGARSPTTTRSQRLWWFRIAAASCLVWLLPLSFFLTHGVKTPYYMTPSVFAAVALLGFGAFGHEFLRTPRVPRDWTLFVDVKASAGEIATTLGLRGLIADGRNGRAALVTWLVVAGSLLPGIVIADRELTLRATTPPAITRAPVAHQPVDLPAELAGDRAWIWADLLSGTLYYYAGKSAFLIPFTDTSTRLTLYRFIFERGDTQYVVLDGPDIALLMTEIQRMGGVLQLRGGVDGYKYYQIIWPKDGPLKPQIS